MILHVRNFRPGEGRHAKQRHHCNGDRAKIGWIVAAKHHGAQDRKQVDHLQKNVRKQDVTRIKTNKRHRQEKYSLFVTLLQVKENVNSNK